MNERAVVYGMTYRAKKGRYWGRLVKVITTVPDYKRPLAKVILLNAWGQETGEQDLIPTAYLE